MTFETILYALLGGVLPALVWLFFWLREDSKSPEPDGLILKTFLFGMLAVVFVLPFQKGVEILFPTSLYSIVIPIVLWAILEEVFKYIAGYFGGIHSIEDNEPIDPMIYMITAALGFVALENTLFIFGPLLGDEALRGFITGNLRFIGASLLHVVASGFIGISLSFSFYKSKMKKHIALICGLVAAIAFHIFFNMLIIKHGQGGTTFAFLSVWVAVALLLLAFERAKSIAPPTR